MYQLLAKSLSLTLCNTFCINFSESTSCHHAAMDSSSALSLNSSNPLCFFLGGTLCYIVSGVAVLVVGVIITSVAFQNLDVHLQESKHSYAGPIMIGAGILIMGKGAAFRVKESDCHLALKRHWNTLRRRLTVSHFFPSPIFLMHGQTQLGNFCME